MELISTMIHWLNDEDHPVVLQRDDVFAMLTWKDFNQAQPPLFTAQTAMWLFVIGAGLPLLMMH